MDGTVNLQGSVNDRDEELSSGSKKRQDFIKKQEQIFNKKNVKSDQVSEP